MQNVSGKIISGKLENPYPERSAPMQRIILAPAACQTRQQTSVFTFWAIFHLPLVEMLNPAIAVNVCKRVALRLLILRINGPPSTSNRIEHLTLEFK